jgi:hypothetical protein
MVKIKMDLKKENEILTDIPQNNRRNKRLFLNTTNLLVLFPKEIKEFKELLYEVFKRAKYTRVRYGHKKGSYPSTELLGQYFRILFEYFQINNYRSFVIWPNQIKDRETLSKIYTLFYSEMTKLHLEILEKFYKIKHQ